MPNITVAFSCDTERDKDILEWLDELRVQKVNKSDALRAMIRAGRATATWTIGDVMAELSEVKRIIRSGVIVSQESNQDQDQSTDPMVTAAQSALDELGL